MKKGIVLLCVALGMTVLGWGLFRLSKPAVPLTLPSPPRGEGVVILPEPILVDDFEVGATQGLFAERKNRLDAFQGTWARRPSYTVITKVPDSRPSTSSGRTAGSGSGQAGKALRIEYSKTGGWCGWYTLLNGIDVSRHNALTFWVKGEKGGERFDIGLADEKMQELEIDAVYAGPVNAFLPQGVTREWQQVKVPLAGLRSDLEMTRMGSLVLWFRYEGKGAVQIDDVSFVHDSEVERQQEANAPRVKPDSRAARSSWVWKYDPLNNLQIREELLAFCKRTAISTIYIYLGEDPIHRTPADYQKRLAEFLKAAHAQELKVEALQGNPLWALKANHPQVVQWVRGYLDFNRRHPASERIDGVSLDIEPYLTSEWESGDREKLKREFVELLKSLRQLIDAERGDSPFDSAQGRPFRLGIAIPVFYNREPEFEEQLLAQVDVAALMDYYDTAVDIIKNGRFHIDLANRLGKKVVIGVETQDLVQMGQGKRRNTFHEEGWEEMEQQLEIVVEEFAKEPSFGGIAIHAYDSYRLLQRGRNVPTRERSEKIPALSAYGTKGPVAIDGDLSDWSQVPWVILQQRSQVLYGVGAWGGPQDLSARMAFQWEPEALLVAFDVTDQALFQERQGADMWEGDHAEVWIDADLEGDYNEAVNSSDDFQFGFSPGNFRNLKPEVHIWVPSVDPNSLKAIQIAAAQRPGGYILEVRVPTKVLFQGLTRRVGVDPGVRGAVPAHQSPEMLALQNGVLRSGQLQPGFRLGVMVDVSDADDGRQPQKCLLSSSPERQWGDPTTFNLLELR